MSVRPISSLAHLVMQMCVSPVSSVAHLVTQISVCPISSHAHFVTQICLSSVFSHSFCHPKCACLSSIVSRRAHFVTQMYISSTFSSPSCRSNVCMSNISSRPSCHSNIIIIIIDNFCIALFSGVPKPKYVCVQHLLSPILSRKCVCPLPSPAYLIKSV